MATAFLNILCPVDFSDHSRAGLGFAAALADHFKARLCVLAVTPTSGAEAGHVLKRLERFATPSLLRVGRLRPPPAMMVRSGDAGDVILDVADDERAELVVMSTHGAGNSTGVYGSTTLKVLAHAAVPLLIVPPALRELPQPMAEDLLASADVVLAPLDFHGRATRDARIAAGIAEAFGLGLLLLHVVPVGAEERVAEADRKLRSLAGEVGYRVPTEARVEIGEAATWITRTAAERKAGLIVMGIHGDVGVPGSPPGSIAGQVIGCAPSLVLALPFTRERTIRSARSADRFAEDALQA